MISLKEDTRSNLSTLSSAMTDSIKAPSLPASVTTDWLSSTCMGRTCLKWSADGELTALDLGLVLRRLAQVDLEVKVLHQWSLSAQTCPSIS